MTDVQLDAIYRSGSAAQLRQIDGRRIVVTGIVGGQSEGLFGGNPPQMQGDIEFDNLGIFDTVDDGRKAAILGTCQASDPWGMGSCDPLPDRGNARLECVSRATSSSPADRLKICYTPDERTVRDYCRRAAGMYFRDFVRHA